MQAETPTGAGPTCCVRQHGAADWGADRPPDPLGDQQHHRDRPSSGQGQERYRQQVDDVAGQHDRPVAAAAVGSASGEIAHTVAEKLSQPGDDTDHHRRGPERAEERSGDAAPALVGHIGEQAYTADQDDDDDRLAPPAARQSRRVLS